ncbi:MAG: ABC transporter permease [Lachnospiraceae bacterium]|nr:ABC transporter permease [Lachnospiraceae bacterium]
MALRMRYLYTEIRKAVYMFPRMLLQAILLMALIGMIAFCAVKTMEREPLAVRADIGVVAREDDRVTRMALQYVENLESASQVCHFIQMPEEEGFLALEKGEIAALVVLPEQIVQGIMDGHNPTVDIFFPKNAGLEAMLLRELTESGAGLLRVAQAQIYGAYDTAAAYGMMEQLSVMETDIDSYNLAFALDRLAVYDTETVSATGQMSVLQYYAASGAVLFLLLSGMALYPVMRREPLAFRRQLARQGTGGIWQGFCQWMSGFVCIELLICVLWLLWKAAGVMAPEAVGKITEALVGRGSAGSMGMKIGMFLLVTVTVSTYIYLLYSMAGSRTGSILLICLISVVMVYLSGGLIPSVFLSETVQKVGEKLPTAYLIRAVGGLYAGYGAGSLGRCAAGMSGYAAVFGVGAYLLRRNDA